MLYFLLLIFIFASMFLSLILPLSFSHHSVFLPFIVFKKLATITFFLCRCNLYCLLCRLFPFYVLTSYFFFQIFFLFMRLDWFDFLLRRLAPIHCGTKVVVTFETSYDSLSHELGSEWASERMSAAECASKANSAEQANEWVVRANVWVLGCSEPLCRTPWSFHSFLDTWRDRKKKMAENQKSATANGF